MYPQKINNSKLVEHMKTFLPYSAEYESQVDFRAKDKPIGVASIYYPRQVKNHNKIKHFETNGCETDTSTIILKTLIRSLIQKILKSIYQSQCL